MTKEQFASIFEEIGFTPIITNYEYDEEVLPVIHMANYTINASVDLMFKVSQFNLFCDGEGSAWDNDPAFTAIHDYFLNHYTDATIDTFLYTGFIVKNDQQPASFVPFIKYTDDGYVRVGIQTSILWSVSAQ